MHMYVHQTGCDYLPGSFDCLDIVRLPEPIANRFYLAVDYEKIGYLIDILGWIDDSATFD
jgi:hypothetical protein